MLFHHYCGGSMLQWYVGVFWTADMLLAHTQAYPPKSANWLLVSTLWKILVNRDDHSQYMGKKSSKPPTSEFLDTVLYPTFPNTWHHPTYPTCHIPVQPVIASSQAHVQSTVLAHGAETGRQVEMIGTQHLRPGMFTQILFTKNMTIQFQGYPILTLTHMNGGPHCKDNRP